MKKARIILLICFCLLVAGLIHFGCSSGSSGSSGPDKPVEPNNPSSNTRPMSLNQVTYWAYQITDVSAPGAVDELVNAGYDMIVIDPVRTDWSSDDRNFDAGEMVRKLKNSRASDNDHRKLVLAYIDIGEAEDWRWYWTWSQDWSPGNPLPGDWPDFIIASDPDGWGGNYPVAFWDPDWQDIIIYGNNQGISSDRDYNSAVDELLKDGFDGIYLDWVEGFDEECTSERAEADEVNTAEEMYKFIKAIRTYARERDPDFLVIQQNAPTLNQEQPKIFEVVDAISQESIWYSGEASEEWDDDAAADVAVDQVITDRTIENLKEWKQANKPIFNVEYAEIQADKAYQASRNEGYIPYCTRRALSRLSTTPPW